MSKVDGFLVTAGTSLISIGGFAISILTLSGTKHEISTAAVGSGSSESQGFRSQPFGKLNHPTEPRYYRSTSRVADKYIVITSC
jgi:hypothetical protein